MSQLADDLERLCCAETEGKFFDLVTDNIATIVAALRTTPPASTSSAVGETDWRDQIIPRDVIGVTTTPDGLMFQTATGLRKPTDQERNGMRYATPPAATDSAGADDLDARQKVVVDWGTSAFGADHMADKIVRAARFFEEAAEMVQAVGLPRDHAQRAFDHVYSRPAGDPAQEAGGSMNTLMALCASIGLSLDQCQKDEIARCLAKDPAHFAARNQTKLREVDAAPAHPPRGPDRDAIDAAHPSSGPYQWPKALAVYRADNQWHCDISFAACPTDAELAALHDFLRVHHKHSGGHQP